MLEDRCYVIYGKGFLPIKIKGNSEKKAIIKLMIKNGFSPKYSVLNSKSSSSKKCKRVATPY